MVVSRKVCGKSHYFLNASTYEEKEKVLLVALKNDKHKRIILEILGSEQITHETLAGRVGVSPPTINWHIRHLKERGIVRANANGRHTAYSIDHGILELLQEHAKFDRDNPGFDQRIPIVLDRCERDIRFAGDL